MKKIVLFITIILIAFNIFAKDEISMEELISKGNIAYQFGNYKKAIKYYKNAIKKEATDEAYLGLAFAYLEKR